MVETFAANKQIVEVEPFNINYLIYKAVAVKGELLPIVSHGQHPCRNLGGMVVTAGAAALCCPIIAGEQTVLAPIRCTVDSQHRIRRTAVESITEVAVVGFHNDALILCRIHSNGHIQRAPGFQADAVDSIR